jgi:glycosyltransferase involved in cell wall biosynthesis
MRDNTLVRHLAALGWDIELVPAYTPIRTDEADVSVDRVFFGGINLYLRQRFPFLRHTPGWLLRWLDHPALIRRATARAGSVQVDPRELGPLTLATLDAEHGTLRGEHERFLRWLVAESRPALLNLTNLLIGGSIPRLREVLPGVPVLVTLQGDDLFLGQLQPPWHDAVIRKMRDLAARADGFITFSATYADAMADLFAVPRERFRIIPLGIDPADLSPRDAGPPDAPPTVGYFARLCPEKGFHHAVDAFLRLARMPGLESARFHFGGWLSAQDRPFFDAQRAKLRDAGLDARIHHAGSPDRAGKAAFLRALDVFSVPADFLEPKGLSVLEALACGVPVVQPAHGSFPELLAHCPAARLVPPKDPDALAAAWRDLLLLPDRGRAVGSAGPPFVRDRAHARLMAEATAEVYREFLGRPPGNGAASA